MEGCSVFATDEVLGTSCCFRLAVVRWSPSSISRDSEQRPLSLVLTWPSLGSVLLGATGRSLPYPGLGLLACALGSQHACQLCCVLGFVGSVVGDEGPRPDQAVPPELARAAPPHREGQRHLLPSLPPRSLPVPGWRPHGRLQGVGGWHSHGQWEAVQSVLICALTCPPAVLPGAEAILLTTLEKSSWDRLVWVSGSLVCTSPLLEPQNPGEGMSAGWCGLRPVAQGAGADAQ